MKYTDMAQAKRTYNAAWGKCRFCKQSALQSEMVKYEVRHHAHAVCLYQRRGIDALNALPTWQLRRLPIIALIKVGISLTQVIAWQIRITAENANLHKGKSTQ